MSGFFINTGNCLETLAERLAQVVKTPLSDPFSPEIIIVQSSGMQRWVSMEIANHNAICANCRFPFPNRFLNDLFLKMNPDPAENVLFEPDILTFRIMQLLPECIEKPEFQNLRGYLADDQNQLKRYQLSRKIADIFDQYQVFRPDMILNWEEGRAKHWQAILWRRLFTVQEARHRAALQKDLVDWIRKQSTDSPDLPERISVFGISYLPTFYLQVLAELSEKIPVHFYLMSPCKEYWGDILSSRQMARIERRFVDTRKDGNPADLHLESGNRLLALLGELGRDFFKRIQEINAIIDEHYHDPGRGSMLAAAQSDLLNLTESKILQSQEQDFRNDRSIQIHSCHSPMREMEVLYDYLLDILESDPLLMPKDIIVMTPDIETYAPYIQAVFDLKDEKRVHIPFNIADRGFKKESRIIDAFTSIIDLKGGRFEASQVMALLEFEAVREKFKLSETDLETVLHWVDETRIRWGRDADDRARFAPEGFSENSWKHGLDRLLLGYAMPGYEKDMFQGILPYDLIEDDKGKILGRLLDFIDQLFQSVTKLNNIYNLTNWSMIFNETVEQFICSSESTEADILTLQKSFSRLAQVEEIVGYHEEVTLEVARAMVSESLEKENYGYGFMSGGVTFCSMLPMRSIPFKVICLAGLNSDAFPRENRTAGFDLIARHPRPGDRSRRNDDKYLFLEALISAREKLYISYIGRNLQDNSQMAPSVLVSELIDYLKENFNLSEENSVIHHPLQAFSPAYFKKSGQLFSYSEENRLGAARMIENAKAENPPPAFISTDLPLTPTDLQDLKTIDLKNLCDFIANPAKFLLRHRLGLYLEEDESAPETQENFSLDALEQFLVGQKMLSEKMAGSNLNDLMLILKAQGRLPIGSVGKVAYYRMQREVDQYLNQCDPYMPELGLNHQEIHLDLGRVCINGRLEGVHPLSGIVHLCFAKFRAKRLLHTWIQHLIHCASIPKNSCGKSFLICKDEIWGFNPVTNSREVLLDLIDFYLEGLSRPLHFFPQTSFVYAESLLLKNKSQVPALNAARKTWEGDDYFRGECKDPYLDLVFRHLDPFKEPFHQQALFIFKPIFRFASQF